MNAFLLPSVLDRLMQELPSGGQPGAPVQTFQQFCWQIRRDLENLLNTRRRCISWPVVYQELEQSVINYGIDDFMNIDLDSAVIREQLCRQIEQVITLFESRFRSVRVNLEEDTETYQRIIKFRIEAMIDTGDDCRLVVFNSSLDGDKKRFLVGEQLF